MIVDGDIADAIAALHEQLDRVLRALGVLDCLLEPIAGISAAVDRDDLVAEVDARPRTRGCPRRRW
jgi:hypothetical protein